jgi:hydroxyacid-oxoacid transhydrogenase
MAITRIAPSRATRALNLLRTINSTHSACPCHSNPGHHHNHHIQNPFAGRARSLATPADFHSQQKEYAFEMAASSIRFGPGCTKEVGMDFRHLGAKKVLVVTDSTVLKRML